MVPARLASGYSPAAQKRLGSSLRRQRGGQVLQSARGGHGLGFSKPLWVLQARHVDHLAIHRLPEHQDEKADDLHPTVGRPRLAKGRGRVKAVVHCQAEDPYDGGTERLKHHTVDSGERPGDCDPRHVVRGARKGVDQDHSCQRDAAAQHCERVELILEVTIIVAGDEVQQREREKQHDQAAPHAFEPDDRQAGEIDLLQEPLLRDDLRRLHDLTAQSQPHPQEQQLRILAFAVIAAPARPPHACEADKNDARNAEGHTKPVEGEQLSSQKDDGKQRCEDHLSTAEQLPNARRDVQEAHRA
mmetsp:Transcript_103587/g.259787  ORF Transcript_103587/g.259787 Transcript_103587/m.259787 type:complete len:301 (+) Transcript_103587:235-1137(+)